MATPERVGDSPSIHKTIFKGSTRVQEASHQRRVADRNLNTQKRSREHYTPTQINSEHTEYRRKGSESCLDTLWTQDMTVANKT